MASPFEADRAVLWYGPRAHTHPGPRNDRAWILWPAWAYRVVAPEPRRRRLNVLQKAVLGALRASRLTASELAARLGIKAELAAFVVLELQGQGRVDVQWTVTRRGVEALDAEQEEDANLVPGWVFRDPWTQGLWPFVASTLECARTQLSDRGFPLLDLGTTGKPWLQSAWVQHVLDGASPTPPDAKEIVRAALRHGRLANRASRMALWDEEGPSSADLGRLSLDRVATIDPTPVPVYLASFLYVPHDAADGDFDWHACDFFGLGSSPELRRLVTRVAEEDANLAGVLDRLLGRTIHGSLADYRRATALRGQRAQALLKGLLTVDVLQHGVTAALTEMLEAWLEVRDLGDGGPAWRTRAVLTGARRAFERVFADFATAWPLRGVDGQLCGGGKPDARERDVNAAKIRRAAADLGFTQVPDALVRVNQNHVRSVANYNDAWRLRPLVAATLLRARAEPQHPLRNAGAQTPDLLARLERVTAAAGGAAHDGNDEQVGVVGLDAFVRETIEITGVLLGLPVRAFDEVHQDG